MKHRTLKVARRGPEQDLLPTADGRLSLWSDGVTFEWTAECPNCEQDHTVAGSRGVHPLELIGHILTCRACDSEFVLVARLEQITDPDEHLTLKVAFDN